MKSRIHSGAFQSCSIERRAPGQPRRDAEPEERERGNSGEHSGSSTNEECIPPGILGEKVITDAMRLSFNNQLTSQIFEIDENTQAKSSFRLSKRVAVFADDAPRDSQARFQAVGSAVQDLIGQIKAPPQKMDFDGLVRELSQIESRIDEPYFQVQADEHDERLKSLREIDSNEQADKPDKFGQRQPFNGSSRFNYMTQPPPELESPGAVKGTY